MNLKFKREYNLDKLADELDDCKASEILEFYFGGVNDRFFEVLRHLSPNKQTATFIDFLANDYG